MLQSYLEVFLFWSWRSYEGVGDDGLEEPAATQGSYVSHYRDDSACGPACERLMDEASCSDSPRGAMSPHPLLIWQQSEESRWTKDEWHMHLR